MRSKKRAAARSVDGEGLDVEALMTEIRRYLAAVDAFRAEGCEPRWAATG